MTFSFFTVLLLFSNDFLISVSYYIYELKEKGRKNMSIINKNKICLNYLIGVLICGFVIYANYIYKMENGTGYTTIVSFALLISVTTLSIFNKNNRLWIIDFSLIWFQH